MHTSCYDSPWVLVDLGSVVPISSIVIYNRTDCCGERTNGIILSILDQNQNTVYTASPISAPPAGGSYPIYTYTLPNISPVGSSH